MSKNQNVVETKNGGLIVSDDQGLVSVHFPSGTAIQRSDEPAALARELESESGHQPAGTPLHHGDLEI